MDKKDTVLHIYSVDDLPDPIDGVIYLPDNCVFYTDYCNFGTSSLDLRGDNG